MTAVDNYSRPVLPREDDALESKLRLLSSWLRDTDSFTRTVAHWLQSPVDYVLHTTERVPVTAEHAAALEVSPSTRAVYRTGVLQTTLHTAPTVVAEVSAAIVDHRLSWTAQQAVRAGDAPLGAILARHEVRRHTHAVTRTSARDAQGEQALKVNATLTVAGRIVAVVDETVYRRLVDGRG